MSADPGVVAYDRIAAAAAAGTLTARHLNEILDQAQAAGVRPVAHDPATLGPLADVAGRLLAGPAVT